MDMNVVDYILLIVLAAVVVLALRKIIRDRRSGKLCSCGDGSGRCGGRCAGCPGCGSMGRSGSAGGSGDGKEQL